MSKIERIEELVSLYSLGALEGDDLKELEAYLKEDSQEIRKLVEENEIVASLLLHSAEDVNPPAYLREKVFEQIKSSESVSNEVEKISFWKTFRPFWYGLGGAAIASALFLIFNYSIKHEYDKQQIEISSLKNTLDEQNDKIETLKVELLEKDEQFAKLIQMSSMKTELVAFIENPNVNVIDMRNLKPNLNSLGRVLWDKNKDSAIFCGLNLPQVPSDKTYQLWAIIDSKPKSFGVFDIDKRGNGVIRLASLNGSQNIQQFAVTLEPAGGVPQPTGEMYLAGDSKR